MTKAHGNGDVDLHRLETTDIELGISQAVQRHVSRHVVPPKPVSQRKLDFEHARPRWLRECLAEATGTFIYVFPGGAAIASFMTNAASATNGPVVGAFGSMFAIGWAFAVGIIFAIVVCAPVSGGHLNPAVTLCLAFWQGFPARKVPHYIASQVLGAFLASLAVAGMYWTQISEMKAEFLAAGKPLVANGGPASILCSFPNPDQTNVGFLFLTEFLVDVFIGLAIWAVLDPANPFVSPSMAPLTIGLAYGAMVWGFADITISTNLARDLGGRAAAAILFGPEAFTYMGYAPIGILVNIPATFVATTYYELVLRDSLKSISAGIWQHQGGEEGLRRHLYDKGILSESEHAP